MAKHPFRPLGLRARTFARNHIRSYFSGSETVSRSTLPPTWQDDVQQPLVWDEPAPTPAYQQAQPAPAQASMPMQPPEAQAPVDASPSVEASPYPLQSVPSSQVTPQMLQRLLDKHEERLQREAAEKAAREAAAAEAAQAASGDSNSSSIQRDYAGGETRMITRRRRGAVIDVPTTPSETTPETSADSGNNESASDFFFLNDAAQPAVQRAPEVSSAPQPTPPETPRDNSMTSFLRGLFSRGNDTNTPAAEPSTSAAAVTPDADIQTQRDADSDGAAASAPAFPQQTASRPTAPDSSAAAPSTSGMPGIQRAPAEDAPTLMNLRNDSLQTASPITPPTPASPASSASTSAPASVQRDTANDSDTSFIVDSPAASSLPAPSAPSTVQRAAASEPTSSSQPSTPARGSRRAARNADTPAIQRSAESGTSAPQTASDSGLSPSQPSGSEPLAATTLTPAQNTVQRSADVSTTRPSGAGAPQAGTGSVEPTGMPQRPASAAEPVIQRRADPTAAPSASGESTTSANAPASSVQRKPESSAPRSQTTQETHTPAAHADTPTTLQRKPDNDTRLTGETAPPSAPSVSVSTPQVQRSASPEATPYTAASTANSDFTQPAGSAFSGAEATPAADSTPSVTPPSNSLTRRVQRLLGRNRDADAPASDTSAQPAVQRKAERSESTPIIRRKAAQQPQPDADPFASSEPVWNAPSSDSAPSVPASVPTVQRDAAPETDSNADSVSVAETTPSPTQSPTPSVAPSVQRSADTAPSQPTQAQTPIAPSATPGVQRMAESAPTSLTSTPSDSSGSDSSGSDTSESDAVSTEPSITPSLDAPTLLSVPVQRQQAAAPPVQRETASSATPTPGQRGSASTPAAPPSPWSAFMSPPETAPEPAPEPAAQPTPVIQRASEHREPQATRASVPTGADSGIQEHDIDLFSALMDAGVVSHAPTAPVTTPAPNSQISRAPSAPASESASHTRSQTGGTPQNRGASPAAPVSGSGLEQHVPSADSVDADLLSLIDLPPTTPIVRRAPSTEQISRAPAANTQPANSGSVPPAQPPQPPAADSFSNDMGSIMRAIESTSNADAGSAADENNGENTPANVDVDKLARDVLDVLRSRLRVEQERRGRKP